MAGVGAILWAILYYIALPFIWVVKTIWAILSFLLAPVVYLLQFVLYACAWPFKFLAKFETLYIYFGIALLVGVGVGALVHYIASFFIRVIGADKASDPQGKSLAAWREERAQRASSRRPGTRLDANTGQATQLGHISIPENSDWLQQDKLSAKSPSVLMSSTILEEEDSSGIEYV